MKNALNYDSARIERRLCLERRQYSYTNYIPERRSGTDRRQDPCALQQSPKVPHLSVVWEKAS